MSQHDDQARLNDMLDHARRAVDAVRGYHFDQMATDMILTAAMERFVEIVGEAASKTTPQTRERLSEIPWRDIIAMRHRLIHGTVRLIDEFSGRLFNTICLH